ncbi:MAG: S8 family serine peptidase [Bacteroidota bacterium]
MKKIITLSILLLLQLSVVFSQVFEQKGIYIETPGQKLPNNYFSPRKITEVPKLDAKYYLPRAIHIKTKQNLSLEKNKYAKLSPSIQSSTSGLGDIKVKALFPDYSEYKKMSEDKYGVGRIYELQYSNPIDPYDVCKELMKNPEIEYAYPIFVRFPYFSPNDPLITNQYYLTNIAAYQAWDVSLGDTTVVIAIVDSGIDYTHPDLQDNLSSVKYDFVGDVTYTDVQSGNWKEDNDPRPSSTNNTHGTHVTGCANAVTNNSIGIASIGARCKYMPIKVGADNPNVNGIYRGYEAILYAAQNGAKVINCSWGGPGFSQAEQDIINQAVALGSVVVVAAGNDGYFLNTYPQYPANYNNVICVGATNQSDKATSFSNYGQSVTVFAPGQSIYSTIPNNRYASFDGTSMASPIVAGLAGLVRSVFPHYTPMQVYHQIRSTVDNFVTNQNDRPLYFGRINAYKALTFNNPKFPDRKIPGCGVVDFSISGSDAITNYARQTLKIKIKNYLSPTSSNFKVKFSSYDKNLIIYGNQNYVGILGNMEEKEFTVDIELKNTNLWFSGYVDVLFSFEDDNYLDYSLVKIPIKIKTENSYATQAFIPASYSLKVNHTYSPNYSSLWMVGSIYDFLGVIYLKNQNGSMYIPQGSNNLEAVYAFSDSKAAVAINSVTSVPSVLITTNQGQNWTTKTLSSYMTLIRNIHFFNDNNGVAIGNPLNNRYGVAITTDGGNTWSSPESTLPTSTGETVLTGSIATSENSIWLGTSIGKIYRSSNQGRNWTSHYVANQVSVPLIAFRDENNGLSVYKKSDGSYNVARTTNAGINWTTEIYDISNMGSKPVYLYSPKNKNVFILVLENGSVYISHNDGESWTPILSRYTDGVKSCAAVLSGNNVRIWMASPTYVSTLDFPIPVSNPTKELTIMNGERLNFGNVRVGSSKIERITLENKGNTRTLIDKVYIKGTNADEFTITVGTSEYVDAGATGNVRIRFNPKTVGEKNAILVIESDASPYRLEFPIVGTAIENIISSFVTSADEILFDSLYIGEVQNRILTITNNGEAGQNLKITVNNPNFSYLPAEETFSLDTGKSVNITVFFQPQTEGTISGILNIQDLLSGLTKNITLAGYGKSNTSIINDFSISGIFPNPVINNAKCMIHSTLTTKISAKVMDLSGKIIKEINNINLNEGDNLIIFRLDELTSGAYILNITNNKAAENYLFIKK